MVFSAAVDIHTAVELFAKNHAHELMGEGHGRKGQAQIAFRLDRFGKPVRISDNEDTIRVAPSGESFQKLGKLLRGFHFALHGKGDFIGFGFSEVGDKLFVFALMDLKGTVTAEAFLVLGDGIAEVGFFEGADAEDGEVEHGGF